MKARGYAGDGGASAASAIFASLPPRSGFGDPSLPLPQLGNHCFAANHGLAQSNQRAYAFGQIKFGTTAKTNNAKAAAGRNDVALMHIADNPPRHPTGDLYHRKIFVISKPNSKSVSLIACGCLLGAGVKKPAVTIDDPGDGTIRRDTIDVHVKEREKNSNPPARFVAQSEFRRRNTGGKGDHLAVCRGKNNADAARRHALGIPKEIKAKQRECGTEPGKPPAEQKAKNKNNDPADQKRLRSGMGRGKNKSCGGQHGEGREISFQTRIIALYESLTSQ